MLLENCVCLSSYSVFGIPQLFQRPIQGKIQTSTSDQLELSDSWGWKLSSRCGWQLDKLRQSSGGGGQTFGRQLSAERGLIDNACGYGLPFADVRVPLLQIPCCYNGE